MSFWFISVSMIISRSIHVVSNGIIDSMDMSLSKFQVMAKDREAWYAAVHGVAMTQLSMAPQGLPGGPEVKNLPAMQKA